MQFISFFNEYVAWGPHLIVILLGIGVYFTVRLKFIQFKGLKKSFSLLFKKEPSKGNISRFGALCTILAASIGTGNIVGVASAIALGGPGALFWLLISAFFGMATIYAEGLLGAKYRQKVKDGYIGGPFYYIEKGLGKSFKPLGIAFAIFGTVAGTFGIGTATQSNSISIAINDFFKSDKTFKIFGLEYTITTFLCSIILTLLVALVIVGGIKRISKVAEILVPFMSIIYLAVSLTVIITHYEKLPCAIITVFRSAFAPKAVLGGAVGITFKKALQMGTGRGIFSNEAGLGTAPITAATADGNEPCEQGLVLMLGPFIDTIVLCSITGLGLIVTDCLASGLKGVELTALAWQKGLPFQKSICDFLLMICLVFFAFSSIIGWNYYTEGCFKYLCKNPLGLKLHRTLYIIAVFSGPFISAGAVWDIADIFNAFMALPNLVALILLSGVVIKTTKGYFTRKKR